MEPNGIFHLNFTPKKENLYLILSNGKNELNQRLLPGDILKFMAAAQEQLDSLFENHFPFNQDRQREWGSLLSQTIFGDESFLTPMFEVIRDADDEDFRLIIGSAMPQVLQFPWEFCYLSQLDFLGASRRMVPVRMPIAKKLTRKAEIEGEPLKVLVYVCAPDDLVEDKALEYEREQEFILEIFDELESQGLVDLQTPLEGDRTSLERYLAEFKPHLLHISGHAIYEKGQLAEQKGGFFLFETPDGLTDPVATEDFCHIFQESHKPHLVVLSACQTAQGFLPGLPGMAQSLLNSVIMVQNRFTDAANRLYYRHRARVLCPVPQNASAFPGFSRRDKAVPSKPGTEEKANSDRGGGLPGVGIGVGGGSVFSVFFGLRRVIG